MVRLEKITALVLAAGLAIPSYWFFWTMAGGGGYERRGTNNLPLMEGNRGQDIPTRSPKVPPGL